MDNQKVLISTIDNLSDSGFSFSLDDYGTGYSNIAYMYDMPFTIIKIDKSILSEKTFHLFKVPVEDFHLLKYLAVGSDSVLVTDEGIGRLAKRNIEEAL